MDFHLLCWFERHCIIKRHIQNGFPVWGAFMFPTSLLRRETEQEGIKLDRNSNFWGNIICLFNSHSMAASWGPMIIFICMIIFKWTISISFYLIFIFHLYFYIFQGRTNWKRLQTKATVVRVLARSLLLHKKKNHQHNWTLKYRKCNFDSFFRKEPEVPPEKVGWSNVCFSNYNWSMINCTV